MGWFGPRLPIDADELEWQFACFKWLLTSFEGLERHRTTPLVTPTVAYFPNSSLKGHARAAELFEQVKAHADMADWPCDLIAGEATRETRVATYHHVAREAGHAAPLGTFSVAGAGEHTAVTITYNPDHVAHPPTLIATFAHELAHYLMATAPEAPPGGEAVEEHATDLTAVFLGFGIFLANNAKQFSAYTDHTGSGWASSMQGYLSESALVTALAIAERLAGRDPLRATDWLKPHLASDLKRTDDYLGKRHTDLAGQIMAIDLSDYA